MLTEARLDEITSLTGSIKVSDGNTQALELRLALRDLLSEVHRLQGIEESVLRVADAAEEGFPVLAFALRQDVLGRSGSPVDMDSCGYCGAREQEFEFGDPVVRGGPRCVDADACHERTKEPLPLP